MRTKARDTFTTIRTEGAILPPDLLGRISEGDRDLGGLDPASYNLPGETLNEAISRSWNRLLGVWTAFKDRCEALPEGQPDAGMTRERWLLPLFRELDYGWLSTTGSVEIEGKTYPVSRVWRHTPIHLVGFRTDLDRRTPGVVGAARVSPHGLVQELLNRSEECLWAFLSNGLRLRILRDNVSLTRQAYVEFDLEAMMDGEVYPDFVLLWLLCHQSRVEAGRPEESWLERWSHAAAEQGTRALEGLRVGVEEAIRSLGAGFLAHRANDGLRDKLRSGDLLAQDYYRQLLRAVYRMLFLFVAEDRGLLLDPDADPKAAGRYTDYYSTARLRRLAEKRVGTRHSDLYMGLSFVMEKLGDERGLPELGLPALGGFLFDEAAVPDLIGCEISNRDLLDAVRALSLVEYDGTHRPVDYKNLGAEELGSIYESLLELHPVLDTSAGTFALEAVSGNERKTTGSYYTPDSLVNSLLDTALDPVLDEATRKPDPEAAILDLKVCDPACGSGHFLIAAAHRIAKRLAAVRTGDGEPSPEATRRALRDVIGRCVYGVDVNPMAVELCKVSLWMEALVPGLPLSFLDHHIKIGNSLLGTTEDLISSGIPNDAFKPIEGDDKQLTRAYAKRNREERKQWEAGQLTLSLRTLDNEREAIEHAYAGVESAGDSSVSEIREKAARYTALESSPDLDHLRLIHDAWCAAFVWPKVEGAPEPITQEVFADLTHRPGALTRESREEAERIGERYGFFHWHLEFPGVFDGGAGGGFDVVLGNPPWERIKLQEQEWFAARRPEIATAPNAAARKRMIKALVEDDPDLHAAFLEDLRKADGESHLIRDSGRFPLCGRGDVNTYSIFAETNRQIISTTGRVGCIVPSGIATDNTTKEFFGDLVDTKTLASLYDFENRNGIFPGVHRSYKFCLLTMMGRNRPAEAADFSFFALDVADLKDPERRFPLSAEDIRLLNPNTRTCPIFRTRRDAEITKQIYRSSIVVKDEVHGGGWEIDFLKKMIDFTIHREFLSELQEDGTVKTIEGGRVFPSTEASPVYEAKLLHHFDHRYASFTRVTKSELDVEPVSTEQKRDPDFVVNSRYWISLKDFQGRLRDRPINFRGILSVRGIVRTTDERTIISCVRPFSPAFNSIGNAFARTPEEALFLCACLNSFTADYVSRQKLGGANLDPFVFFQLAVVSPESAALPCLWDGIYSVLNFVYERALELSYTAWDLEPFARDLGYDGPPFRWDPERRFLLRCELDAAFFHLYGIGRDDADYIMETFPIVKRKDEAAHGEYRTKRVILEIYDAMQKATETGQPYRTPLDPPPVDLGASEPGPATVTPLRPVRPARDPAEKIEYRPPEEFPALGQAAEEREQYSTPSANRRSPDANGPPTPVGPEPKSINELSPGELCEVVVQRVYEAGSIQREVLLTDAARSLKLDLDPEVRSRLEKAVSALTLIGMVNANGEHIWSPNRR